MLKVSQNRLNKKFTAWQEVVHREKDAVRNSSSYNVEQCRLKNNSLCAKMMEVKKLYSTQALSKFPAVFFPHLIFRSDSISTAVGRRLVMLQREGRIMCFNLPTCGPSKAIVFSKDLLFWHKQICPSNVKIERFIKHVVPRLSGLRVQKGELVNLKLTDRDICDLIRAGFLVYVAESTYELTIPCAGEFSKIFMEGRNAIVVALNKSPDNELLKSELRDKEFVKKRMFLGLDYHIADIIGLRIADSIETTEGYYLKTKMKISHVAAFKQFLAASSCSFGVLIVGTAIGWSSPVLSKITKESEPFKMTEAEINWMVCFLYAGNIISPFPAGYVMDLIGRRNTLLLLSVIPISGWLMVYFATRPYHLYIARLLSGAWHGALATIIPLYISEISEARIRGALVTMVQLSLNIGIVFSFIVGSTTDYHTFALILCVMPLVFLLCFGFMPESPYWLLMKDKKESAAKSLMWLRGREDESIDSELEYMDRSLKQEMERKKSIKVLFSDKSYKQAIITVFILSICQRMSGVGVILAYASSTLSDGVGVLTADQAVIVLGVAWCVVVPFATFLIDNMGRRPLLIISSICCGITTFFIGLVDYLLTKTSVNMTNIYWLDFASLLIFGVGYVTGLGPAITTIQGEIFPVNIKAIASAITVEVSAFTSLISIKIYQPLSEAVGSFLVYWIFSLFCFVVLLFTIFYVIETKGKTLYEIQLEIDEKRKRFSR